MNTKNFFNYNTLICTVRCGQYIHIISNLIYGYGFQHACWNVCTTRYHYVPKVENTHNDASFKHSGKVWKKKMDYKKVNSILSGPKNIRLILEFNGVSDCLTILNESITFIINQLDCFYQKLTNSKYDYITFGVKDSILKISNEMTTVPDTGEETGKIGDHTIGNLISSYLLKYYYDLISKNLSSDEISTMLEKSNISYRKAHPLNDYITMKIQLPETSKDFFIKYLEMNNESSMKDIKIELLRRTIKIIKNDLSDLVHSIPQF